MPELLAADRHLLDCVSCRSALEASLFNPAELHLTYEDLLACVQGNASDEAVRHAALCSVCSADIDELRAETRVLLMRRPPSWRPSAIVAGIGVAAAAVLMFVAVRPPQTAVSPVPAAVTASSVKLPVELLQLRPSLGVLLGPPADAATWRVVSPSATIVSSDRPEFRWESLAGVSAYQIAVFDDRLQRIASAAVKEPRWVPDVPLPRGVVLQWQVRAGSRTAPAPPQPDARFRVLRAEEAARWAQLQSQDTDRVRLGLEAARLGLREEALRILTPLPGTEAAVAELRW
ncbi:MAG: hypothetical protein SGI92_02330 [Bryobacteraceae bacterium]|nr:hypothetical protein [Bryobacteraceae bacterium]